MAFSIYASTGDTTTQLNDGQPFRLESAEGLGGSNIIRHEQRGPLQGGVTDLGFRLEPRTFTLNLLFYADDDATLDTHRQTLMSAFSPLESITTFLSIERDDGEIRSLRCHRTDEISIQLLPEHRPGHLHRATVVLRAATPLWQANETTMGSADFTALATWWLAGGAISESDSKVHVENPAQGEAWPVDFTGTTGTWAVAIVTEPETSGTVQRAAWSDSGTAGLRRHTGGGYSFNNFILGGLGTNWQGTTELNFHAVQYKTNSSWFYWNGTEALTTITGGGDTNLGSVGVWRQLYGQGTASNWTPEIPKATIFLNPTDSRMSALARYMLNIPHGIVDMVNDGDVNAYPLITLHGPIVDPVIVNQTTGGTIDLTGTTIGEGEVWTIDLRDGNKRVTDHLGDVRFDAVASPLSLASFYLAPGPVASGGTTRLVMTPGSVGSAAFFMAEITKQYTSF